MSIQIIATFDNARQYMISAERGDAGAEELWQRHMIEPFWADIARWAPFDQGFKQPPRVEDIGMLRAQLLALSDLSTEALQADFEKIAGALPMPADEDAPMLVALYPAQVGEALNGVVGASVFGNVVLRIDPLVEGYRAWIPFVFAHEYHHNAWGYNQFVLRGGRDVQGTFLEYMITEGEADAFAQSLFPELTPKWNRPFGGETETALWERVKPVLFSKDPAVHGAYMFGDEGQGLPWNMGYAFGAAIIADYRSKHPDVSFAALIDVPADEIWKATRFSFEA